MALYHLKLHSSSLQIYEIFTLKEHAITDYNLHSKNYFVSQITLNHSYYNNNLSNLLGRQGLDREHLKKKRKRNFYDTFLSIFLVSYFD